MVATVDTTSLNRALFLAARTSTRDFRNIIDSTGFFIAVKAQLYTPAVDQETINSELDVTTFPAILESGKRSTAKNKQNSSIMLPVGRGSLAEMIVVARMHPGSKYSMMTDNRWPVTMPRTEGIANFWFAVQEIAEKMIKARHSSTAWFKAGWGMVAKKLRQGFTDTTLEDQVIDIEAEVLKTNDNFGAVTKGGTASTPWLTLENLIGLDPDYPTLARSRNDALIRYGTGPLQKAVSEQAAEMQARYLPRFEAKLAMEFNAQK